MTSAAPMTIEKRTSELEGSANHSPGLISGNAIDIPINIPINACGDTIDIIGLLNPASGNVCEQKEEHDRHREAHKDKEVDIDIKVSPESASY
ncbi:hypothetical protein EDD11_010010 [Mortierella claussenii]|nr:hypothetical protein EDD11_010010 [Mortierella claussenii]